MLTLVRSVGKCRREVEVVIGRANCAVISGAGRLEVQAAEAVTHDDGDGPISPALRVSLDFRQTKKQTPINNYKRLRLSSSRTLI
jgi:hypothetical protein